MSSSAIIVLTVISGQCGHSGRQYAVQFVQSRCRYCAGSPGPMIIVCPVFSQYDPNCDSRTSSAIRCRIGFASISKNAGSIMPRPVKRIVFSP